MDDHVIVRQALTYALNSTSIATIVFDVSSGVELLKKLERDIIPDVVIMDLNMPDMDGYSATKILSRNYPDVRVLVLSMSFDKYTVLKCIKSGAVGHLPKEGDFPTLVNALKNIVNNGYYYTPFIKSVLETSEALSMIDSFAELLTRREKEVLLELAKGKTNTEISKKLFISTRTVEGHRANIYRKMEVPGGNLAALINKARQNDLLPKTL